MGTCDFCEAQDGKGDFDRTAATINFFEEQDGKGDFDLTEATIKSGIRRYVNQCHDVVTCYQHRQ